MKLELLLAVPDTVTTKLPADAVAGTWATILVALQLIGVTAVPSNATVLLPWDEPKFAPLMVTWIPAGPEDGDKLEMTGEVVPPRRTAS